MVNEDGIAELRRRSVRVAAVRRYSKHTAVHRRSAEGGGGTLPALPLAAIQDRWSTEALHTRTLTLTLNLAVTLSPCPGPDPNPSPGSIRSPSPTALAIPCPNLFSEALYGRSACERLHGLKVGSQCIEPQRQTLSICAHAHTPTRTPYVHTLTSDPYTIHSRWAPGVTARRAMTSTRSTMPGAPSRRGGARCFSCSMNLARLPLCRN